MILFSHRGLDFDREEALVENSLAALQWAAERGFGIEVDLQIDPDGGLYVSHDSRLLEPVKMSGSVQFVENVESRTENPPCRFSEVLELVSKYPSLMVAIHIKGYNQYPAFVASLIRQLSSNRAQHHRLLLFDLRPETALQLRAHFPDVGLAASVAHEFDIERFNRIAHGTLLGVNEFLKICGSSAAKDLEVELTGKAGAGTGAGTAPGAGAAIGGGKVYDWAWLDEWDRLDPKGGSASKALYSHDLIQTLRDHGLKISLISPELHSQERHQDAGRPQTLERRWNELIAIGPDAICTDFASRIRSLLKL